MSVLILAGLAVAWVLVLLPSRKAGQSPSRRMADRRISGHRVPGRRMSGSGAGLSRQRGRINLVGQPAFTSRSGLAGNRPKSSRPWNKKRGLSPIAPLGSKQLGGGVGASLGYAGSHFVAPRTGSPASVPTSTPTGVPTRARTGVPTRARTGMPTSAPANTSTNGRAKAAPERRGRVGSLAAGASRTGSLAAGASRTGSHGTGTNTDAFLGSAAAWSTRQTTPLSTIDAAIRRRDITAILLAAALITLIALFITQQAWLGVLNIGLDAALIGYLWLVSRRSWLHSARRPHGQSH